MVLHNQNTSSSSLDSIEPENKPLKVLFLSSDTGGGHRASAESLGAQFQALYPGSTYTLLDIMKDHSSAPYNKLVESYKHLSNHPKQWNLIYKISNSPPVDTFVRTHLKITTERNVRRAIQGHCPDVVISVHPLMTNVPVTSCQKISSETGKHLPIFTVVTDLGSGHCTWFDAGVEKMFIASQQIQELAIKRGKVPKRKLVMSGLPIRKDFAIQATCLGAGGRNSIQGNIYQMQVRDMLGIGHSDAEGMIHGNGENEHHSDHRVVLVMGGGEGVGSLSSIVDSLYIEMMLEGINATIVVVCGRNEKLKKSLETRDWNTLLLSRQNEVAAALLKKKGSSGRLDGLKGMATLQLRVLQERVTGTSSVVEKDEQRGADDVDDANAVNKPHEQRAPVVLVHPLGFVNNMAEYMVAADVLVTKAGPGTIAEAAAVGLPVLLTSFLPGQEEGNVDFVIEKKFGAYESDASAPSIAKTIAAWLKDSTLLTTMSQYAMDAGRPNAAEDIARKIGTSVLRWKELHPEEIIPSYNTQVSQASC